MALPVALVPLLSTVFLWIKRAFILKFIAALGLGIYSYREVSNFFDWIKANIDSGMSQLPATALALLDIGGLTTGIEIMVSGMAFLAGFYAMSWGFGVFAK